MGIIAIKFLDNFTAKITFSNCRSKVIDWRKNLQLRAYKDFFSVQENWRSAYIHKATKWVLWDLSNNPEYEEDKIPLIDFQVFQLNRRRFDRPIRRRRRSERRRRR